MAPIKLIIDTDPGIGKLHVDVLMLVFDPPLQNGGRSLFFCIDDLNKIIYYHVQMTAWPSYQLSILVTTSRSSA